MLIRDIKAFCADYTDQVFTSNKKKSHYSRQDCRYFVETKSDGKTRSKTNSPALCWWPLGLQLYVFSIHLLLQLQLCVYHPSALCLFSHATEFKCNLTFVDIIHKMLSNISKCLFELMLESNPTSVLCVVKNCPGEVVGLKLGKDRHHESK